VFELRTYHTNDGKLADLHKRFRDHTCQLLKKHGAKLIGFWTPLDDKDGKGSKLIYLVAFPDREAARKTWKEFSDDPEWKKVYAESHKNGVMVNKVESVFLEPQRFPEEPKHLQDKDLCVHYCAKKSLSWYAPNIRPGIS